MSKLPKANRFEPSQIDNGSLKIPRTALRFDADVEIKDSKTSGTIPISLRARSGNVLNHWYFGRCVHDFAGMRPASAKLPFDYCHLDTEVLGYSDSQDVSDGLVMHGVLIPFKKKDRVDEVVTKAAAGFEWQGSIYFDIDELILEYVPEGMTSPVNGGMFEGPGVIFRDWMLRGAAICPYGYDPNTSAQFSNQGDEIAVSFVSKGSVAMAKKITKGKLSPNRHDRRKAAALAAKPAAKPKGKLAAAKPVSKPAKPSKFAADEGDEDDDEEEEELEAEEMEADDEGEAEPEDGTETEGDCDCEGEEDCECDEEEDAEEGPVEEMESDEGEQSAKGKHSAKKPNKAKLSAAQKEAQRFITAFGAQGGVWYAEGLSFDQAQTRFNKSIRDENAKLKKKVGKLSTQLAEMRGEDEPLSATPAEERGGKGGKSKQFNGLTSGAAKFAANIKIRR